MFDKTVKFLGPDKPQCPNCFITQLGATKMDEGPSDRPQPGDRTMCIKCGALLKFDESLSLEPLTPEEVQESTRNEPEMLQAFYMLREAWLEKTSKAEESENG